ncbi:hypothetical protein SmJEL517_g01433 [Synchytrium microbalum]|uniref:DM2 domain-containing protein n=1 Tax=Synchytrium microbalum TaxID=1806994 RepID=A0A507CDQ7_9FUNG|nr:uncharacterized protein SmJEL517_g01433 [Synchytrium microbalum]TPX36176.1 hypothetical protein SmJEL517_g01433 [Synchytrium microbalum]
MNPELYRDRIKEILAESDPTVVTARRIRKQLEDERHVDLTPIKKQIDQLVVTLFDESESPAVDAVASPPPPVIKKTASSKAPPSSSGSRATPPPQKVTPKPKPKSRQVKSSQVIDSDDDGDHDDDDGIVGDDDESGMDSDGIANQEKQDAKLARQLQEMDNPRGRTRRAAAPLPKRKASAKKKNGDKASNAGIRKRGGGFTAPVLLSPALSEFLGGVTLMARTQVTKEVWKYIKEHELQDPKSKITVVPDEALKKVLGTSRIHGFKMTKILSSHMSKPDEVSANKYKEEHAHDLIEDDDTSSVNSNEDIDDLDDTPVKAKKSPKSAKKKKVGGGTGGGFNKPYQLSEALSALCKGARVLSRPKVVKYIWKYIKGNNLQDPKDKRNIICDENLAAVMGHKKVTAFSMNKYIGNHLSDADGAEADIIESDDDDEKEEVVEEEGVEEEEEVNEDTEMAPKGQSSPTLFDASAGDQEEVFSGSMMDEGEDNE